MTTIILLLILIGAGWLIVEGVKGWVAILMLIWALIMWVLCHRGYHKWSEKWMPASEALGCSPWILQTCTRRGCGARKVKR